LLDSWAWIEYWRGSKHADKAASYIESAEEALISSINLAEIYVWILRQYGQKQADAKKSVIARRCFVVNLDPSIAVEAAKIKHYRRMALADSIVLATAIKFSAKVVTGDADFEDLREAIFIGN
jgi:predicted nucleic acid-binding protein